MNEQDKKRNRSTGFEALVLCSQLGLTLAMPIVLGAAIGHWLDQKLGTELILLVLLTLAGVVAGLAGAYRQITAVTGVARTAARKAAKKENRIDNEKRHRIDNENETPD